MFPYDARVSDALFGREPELAAVERFLAAAATGPAGLLIEGAAGIGKSALWAQVVADARNAGRTVLACRPVGAEATFSYAALGDLIGDRFDAVRRRLPPPQEHALAIALLRSDPAASGAAVEAAQAQLVSAAVASVLRAMADDLPLVLAIDDAPWMDAASARSLAFAVRRFGDRPAGIIVAARRDEPGPVPLDLDTALPADRLTRLWLQPLKPGALHGLLHQRLSTTFSRPALMRLHETSGGNPFFGLELGRALQRRGVRLAPGEPLPVPGSLRELIDERLSMAGSDARSLLLVAAASVRPTFERMTAALASPESARAGLAAAELANLASLEQGRIQFSHPLVASTVYAAATAAERRSVHARLADLADDAESRARHLALANNDQDAESAAALESVADAAHERGATHTAAELYALARDRTPATDREAAERRTVLLGRALVESGDMVAGRDVLAPMVERLPAGPTRAEAQFWLGTIAWYTDTGHAAGLQLLSALADAGDDPWIRGRIELRLSIFLSWDTAAAREHAAAAVRDLDAALAVSDRPQVRVSLSTALYGLFYAGVLAGEAPQLDLLERALSLEPSFRDPDTSTVPGIWWCALDQFDRARARYQAMLEASREIGELTGEADLLTRLAEVELWSDHWPAALHLADAAVLTAEQTGNEHADAARRIRALVVAHQGDLRAARAEAEAAIARLSGPASDPILVVAWLVVLCFVAVSEGDAAGVERSALQSAALLEEMGVMEPMRLGVAHERAEALASLGEVDRAAALLEDLGERQRRIPRPWLRASLSRSRAQLLAAGGDVPAALAVTDEAVQPAAATGWREFDRARTLLLRAALQRRLRDRAGASASLAEAGTIFRTLGAAGWAQRTDAELTRLGRDRRAEEGLTPAEIQLAALTASGLTNRAVAARLFMSPKTVEAHLSRIYAKLGIRSRAELGRAMADGSVLADSASRRPTRDE